MSCKTQGHHERILKWIEHVQTSGGVDRYDDLHIDLIDSSWKPRAMWVVGGISALTLASSMQSVVEPGLVVVLGMSLLAEEPFYPIPGTAHHLLEQLDKWTPPSLYLFRLGEEPWHNPRSACRFIEQNLGSEGQQIKGVYLESRSKDGERRRSLFMIRAEDLHRELL
jgi:hypothetical protein